MTDEETVTMLLAAAGLPATPDTVAMLTGMYPMVRAMVELVHAVDAGDEPPCVTFRADPTFVDWA